MKVCARGGWMDQVPCFSVGLEGAKLLLFSVYLCFLSLFYLLTFKHVYVCFFYQLTIEIVAE